MQGDVLYQCKGHVVLEGAEMVQIIHVHEAETYQQALQERADFVETLDEAIAKIQEELRLWEYLESLVRLRGTDDCLEGYVLEHGREYVVQERPGGVKQGGMKDCFKNALNLAMKNRQYTYVEGYAVSKISDSFHFPAFHAWCADAEGKVVDPTWKDGIYYYGVPIDTTEALKIVLKHKVWGVLVSMLLDQKRKGAGMR